MRKLVARGVGLLLSASLTWYALSDKDDLLALVGIFAGIAFALGMILAWLERNEDL